MLTVAGPLAPSSLLTFICWTVALALEMGGVATSVVRSPEYTCCLYRSTAHGVGDDGWTLKHLQQQPAEVHFPEEPQLVHRLDLRTVGGLEVVGHRLRSQYPVLSWAQLERDLRTDSIIQKALAKQWALLTVRVATWQPGALPPPTAEGSTARVLPRPPPSTRRICVILGPTFPLLGLELMGRAVLSFPTNGHFRGAWCVFL